MFGSTDLTGAAHVVQLALTPIFLLTGLASDAGLCRGLSAIPNEARLQWRKTATNTRSLFLLIGLMLSGCDGEGENRADDLVVWAWERPEDLRFLPEGVEVAAQTGFVEIFGDGFVARGRRFPLLVKAPPETALVHVQIDDRAPPRWTPMLRRRVAGAVLHFARAIPARRVQIDFEVRRSQQAILIDLIGDVRHGLPHDVALSMTALASWCQEDWLHTLPVDEIVPMLFRMGRGDSAIRAAIATGDWHDPACRHALAVSVDTPIAEAPAGRRVYLFDPRSWTKTDFDSARHQVGGWH